MKESKSYPILEEEDGSITAAEPVTGAYIEETRKADCHPASGLPQTWDELMENFDEGIEEYERGECVEWEDVVLQMKQHRRYGS